jgi:hypothetical protein
MDDSPRRASLAAISDSAAALLFRAPLGVLALGAALAGGREPYAGQNLGGRFLDWAGDRACRAGAQWLRLDAWTTNERLQRYYLDQGFQYVRTVLEGNAVNGGPRVSGWLAQRPSRLADHGFADETPSPEPLRT